MLHVIYYTSITAHDISATVHGRSHAQKNDKSTLPSIARAKFCTSSPNNQFTVTFFLSVMFLFTPQVDLFALFGSAALIGVARTGFMTKKTIDGK